MASNKRNKKYRPGFKNPNPLSPNLTLKERNGLKQLGEVALAHLAISKGTLRHWSDLACRLLVGRTLAIKFFKEDEIGERIHNSIARLVQIYHFEYTKPDGTWELPDMDLTFVSECLEMIDVMLEQITRREYGEVYIPISKMQINILAEDDVTWEEFKARTET